VQTFWTLKLTEIWGEPKQGLTAQNEDGVGSREKKNTAFFLFSPRFFPVPVPSPFVFQ